MVGQMITRHKKLVASGAILVLFALVPLFIHSPYRIGLLITIIVNAVLGMAFNMMMRNGLLSIAIAVFWGIGAYSSAVLTTQFNLSFWLALPASVLITSVFALIFGILLLARSGGLTFLLLCAVLGMVFTVAIGSTSFLGGYNGIANIPPPDPISLPFLPTIEFTSEASFFYLALFLLVIVILVVKAFYSAWTGRAWIAIGLNPRLAESIGVNVFKYRLLAFIVSSALAGLIGSFYASYQGFIIGDTFSMWVNVNIILYAILGGVGHAILGPIVGSAVMTFVPEFLRMTNEVASIFIGGLLIVLILFLPGGLLSLWDERTEIVERLSRIGKAVWSLLLNRRNTGKT